MPTLTVSEILSDVLDAFKQRVPALSFFSTDMSNEQVMQGQQIIAHLPTMPNAVAHVAATGYNPNAQSARDLLTDVPITMDQWTDVQIKILAADASQDRSKNYLKTISNAGYVLGKAVVDFALTKVVEASFSEQTIALTDDTDLETLNGIRADMNLVKAAAPRFGIVNSATFNALESDPRIASGDYHNQRTGEDPYGKLVNLAGFKEIIEYPDFPDNSQSLAGFFFDSRAVAVATRLPDDSVDLAGQLGLPVTFKKEVVTDPQTGLSIVGYGWIDPVTHYIYLASSVMYGAVAGSQAASSAGTKLDYAGHLLATAE
jgi:hypothetical protein